MTAAFEAAPDPQSAEPVGDPTLIRLRSDLEDRVRRGITDGVLPPGTLLSRMRILADAGLTSTSGTRVDLALQDLAADGLVVVRYSNQVLVAGPRKTYDQVTVAADLLRVLVSTGIYPLMSSLPNQQDLSRLLAAERPTVSRALHRLHEEGYLFVQHSRRAVVRPVPPVSASGPPTLDDLVGRLCSAAPSSTNLDRAGLRESCRRAKVWWHRRSLPDAESLREVRQSLVAAAAALLPLAARRPPDAPDAYAVLGYAVTAALHGWLAEREIEVWRLACVATAVLDVLDLAGDVA
ncbi:GntR family transcriptional regulator [Streptomyces sp. NPDC048717]|uniref:GntR family transcriptional regulator n=1 Tax=Streptomyces sp. NPDC048717 TaxID=3154928 RepID=UPI003416104F